MKVVVAKGTGLKLSLFLIYSLNLCAGNAQHKPRVQKQETFLMLEDLSLVNAINRDDIDRVEGILARGGINLNASNNLLQNYTPFGYSVSHSRLSIARVMLCCGADPYIDFRRNVPPSVRDLVREQLKLWKEKGAYFTYENWQLYIDIQGKRITWQVPTRDETRFIHSILNAS